MCAEVGLTDNKSDFDEHGWDYIVEYQLPDIGLPLDQQDCRMDCRVQVKSTDGSSGSASITLSNFSKVCLPMLPI